MYELRELLLKDNPGADAFWAGDPRHLTVTLLDGVEHAALKLAQKSKDPVLKHNATQLPEDIRKYRKAVAENRWDDADRLVERVDSLYKDVLELYLDEVNEHALARDRKVHEGGRRSRRKKHPAIFVELERLLQDNPDATNLQLWKSFSSLSERTNTGAGRFELYMDAVEAKKGAEETRLYIYPVRKDGTQGPCCSIAYNTFKKNYVPEARKKF